MIIYIFANSIHNGPWSPKAVAPSHPPTLERGTGLWIFIARANRGEDYWCIYLPIYSYIYIKVGSDRFKAGIGLIASRSESVGSGSLQVRPNHHAFFFCASELASRWVMEVPRSSRTSRWSDRLLHRPRHRHPGSRPRASITSVFGRLSTSSSRSTGSSTRSGSLGCACLAGGNW